MKMDVYRNVQMTVAEGKALEYLPSFYRSFHFLCLFFLPFLGNQLNKFCYKIQTDNALTSRRTSSSLIKAAVPPSSPVPVENKQTHEHTQIHVGGHTHIHTSIFQYKWTGNRIAISYQVRPHGIFDNRERKQAIHPNLNPILVIRIRVIFVIEST